MSKVKSIYFIGAGGIRMSALVRYFLTKRYNVGGYDRTPSELTEKLISEGAQIHYEENVDTIPACFKEKDSTSLPIIRNWCSSAKTASTYRSVH